MSPSPPPSPLPGSSPTGSPHPASRSPSASPAPSSTLNPNATPFFSVGHSASWPFGELLPSLAYTPSSSSSEEMEARPRPRLSSKDKGKAPLIDDCAPPPRRGRSPPPSGFIEAARRAPSLRHRLVANRQSHQPAEGRKLASILIHDSQEDGWQTVVRKRSIVRLLRLRATSPDHLTQDCRCLPRGLWSFHPPSSAPVASSATSARPSSGSAVCFSYYDDMF
jgi:hypothetical protein